MHKGAASCFGCARKITSHAGQTAMRYQKDRGVLAMHAGNVDVRRDAQGKIDALMARYEKISDKAGIGERRERTYVKGYAPVKANDALSDRLRFKNAEFDSKENMDRHVKNTLQNMERKYQQCKKR